MWVSECVGFNIPLDTQQVISGTSLCTGTDNQTTTKRKYTKHKITNLTEINWP